ncbi:MAG: four helix bundle protein [Planctomycetaceae bacterium]
MFRFEKLAVWQKGIEFANRVYGVTRSFPNDERFGLTSQMRRASVSVSSNIAEGSGRSSDNDFARFVEIAYGSLMEVVSQMNIAKSQEFLQHEDFEDLSKRADELSRMLSGLRTTLKTRKSS